MTITAGMRAGSCSRHSSSRRRPIVSTEGLTRSNGSVPTPMGNGNYASPIGIAPVTANPTPYTAGLVCLASGILLGLGSKYGLVRYWWVAVKLALNLVLCTLILIALQPGLGEIAQYGRDLAAGTATERDMTDLFFPPIVSLSALTFATILSVAKPWGRLRKRG